MLFQYLSLRPGYLYSGFLLGSVKLMQLNFHWCMATNIVSFVWEEKCGCPCALPKFTEQAQHNCSFFPSFSTLVGEAGFYFTC